MRRKLNLHLILNLVFLLSGCHTSPSQDILGSYFPSWLLCTFIGFVLTVIIHIVLIKVGVDEFIPMKLLVYVSLAASLTFCIWLIWFGN
ncbi:YtcA family lipoprotein [Legionella fallonii]|uniref:YtcA family lipoprotein n=1 Tax=Legionella fallonii TaxID=96230 RepID=UPI000A0391FC|nr:YtcA family lipoprotein [Legionella fallonii]